MFEDFSHLMDLCEVEIERLKRAKDIDCVVDISYERLEIKEQINFHKVSDDSLTFIL